MSSLIDLAALVLCIVFLTYVCAIIVPFLRRVPDQPGSRDDFTWHLILPCLDEAVVIARTIVRLRSDHPEVHLWCVNDASSDHTGAILDRLARLDPRLHAVHRVPPEAREGKGAALNAAWRQINAWTTAHMPGADPAEVVVGVVDADGRLDPQALDVIAGPSGFGDPTIGAVQVQVRMLNRGLATADADDPASHSRLGRLMVTMQDLEFRTVIAAMQNLRHRMGSAGMGGNGQFTRLAVLNEIARDNDTPWHGALLEDFELGLHVMLAGWGNRYCNDTWVAQEGLPDVKALIRQRARWAQGGMQCVKYFREILLSPQIKTPSAIEISYFLLIPWTQLLGTIVYALSGLVMAGWAFTAPDGISGWFLSGGWGLVPLAVAFGIAPLAVWGFVYRSRCEPTLTRRAALGLGLGYWLYTYVMLASVWRGFWRVLRNRNSWAKTQRVLATAPRPSYGDKVAA
jgi:cellulose synthase/poly-beta-1,6-N-acetylglucosamine synthase-like glycosyltransferase